MSWFRLAILWVMLMLLSACGGGTSSSSRVQMGGAIQGTSLNLSRTVTTFAGSAANGSSNGSGVAAGFWNPAGITTDGANLYVADSANNTIRKIVIAFGNVTTLAGSAGKPGSSNGTGSTASFNNPQGITTDGTNLYVSDSGNNAIRKVVIATGAVSSLAGSSAGTPGSANGTSGAASFSNPQGITTDGVNLYVADSSNNTIRTISLSTGAVTTLAGIAGTAGSADSAPGVTPSFWNPLGITTDGVSLYVTDSNNNTIRRVVIATGAVTTMAGSAGNPVPTLLNGAWIFSNYSSPNPVNGTGAFSRFIGPAGITSDGKNLYVTDAASTIRKIVIATGVVTTLAGKAGFFALSDGLGTDARFWFPQGITTDGRNLYVADKLNNTIRKVF